MIRAFVLIIVAAVLANAQCYGACATADCHSAQPSSPDSCHHHKSPPPTGGVCQHQHASIAGPENGAGLSKPHAAASARLIAVLLMQENLFVRAPQTNAALIQSTIPPGAPISPGSAILRI